MEEKSIENEKFPVSHMINAYDPQKSLEIVFADKNDKETYRVKLDAEHNLREGPVEKCYSEYDVYEMPGEVLTKKNLYDLSAHVAHYDNERVAMGDPTDVMAIVVDGERVFDRQKENAKYLAVSVKQENEKVQGITVVDLSGKPLLDKTYDEKHTVSRDKRKIETLFRQAKYIAGFDMAKDMQALKSNGINLPTGRKYFDVKDNHEYLSQEKIIGKDKVEKWKYMQKDDPIQVVKFDNTTKNQARAIIGDFENYGRIEMYGQVIPKDRKEAALKKLDKVLSQEKENIPKKKGIHRKASSQSKDMDIPF